jgi:hypothetical protein
VQPQIPDPRLSEVARRLVRADAVCSTIVAFPAAPDLVGDAFLFVCLKLPASDRLIGFALKEAIDHIASLTPDQYEPDTFVEFETWVAPSM